VQGVRAARFVGLRVQVALNCPGRPAWPTSRGHRDQQHEANSQWHPAPTARGLRRQVGCVSTPTLTGPRPVRLARARAPRRPRRPPGRVPPGHRLRPPVADLVEDAGGGGVTGARRGRSQVGHLPQPPRSRCDPVRAPRARVPAPGPTPGTVPRSRWCVAGGQRRVGGRVVVGPALRSSMRNTGAERRCVLRSGPKPGADPRHGHTTGRSQQDRQPIAGVGPEARPKQGPGSK